MADLVRVSCVQTTNRQYTQLQNNKGISASTLKSLDVCINFLTGRWIIPIVNAKGTTVNLYTWDHRTNKILCSPELGHSFWILGSRNKKNRPLLVCEGHWDALAVYDLMRSINRVSKYNISAAPGANVFKEPWLQHFRGRDVRLLYDNDDPGRNGTERVVGMIHNSPAKPSKLSVLQWDEETPDKYDVRDLYQDRSNAGAFNFLLNNRIEVDLHDQIKDVEPSDCDSFNELVDYCNENLHFTQALADTLATMLATVISCHFNGDPLWLYVIGPPSSGKSTLAEIVSCSSEYVHRISKMTDTTLVSGWRPSGNDPHDDSSLLPRLNNKCLVVKDFTTVLSMEQGAKERLYGILRDCYDGSFSAQYGNQISREYSNLRFSMICGVTDEIRMDNRSSLGERFVSIECMDDKFDRRRHTMMAMTNVTSDTQRDSKVTNRVISGLASHCLGFLHRVISSTPELRVTVSDESKEAIYYLAEFVAHLRSRVPRDFRGDPVLTSNRPEIATRLAKQLLRLGLFLSVVLDKEEIDNDVLRIIRKVAIDSAKGFYFDLLMIIWSLGGKASTPQIKENMSYGVRSVGRWLSDMSLLGILKKRSGRASYGAHMWDISDFMNNVLEQVEQWQEQSVS